MLKRINLQQTYKKEFMNYKNKYMNKTLPALLTQIRKEENCRELKDELLATCQLYYDGIVDNPTNNEMEELEKHQILQQLYKITQKTVTQFYQGQEINKEQIFEKIMPISTKIFHYGSQKKAKLRHLMDRTENIQNFVIEAEKKFENNKPDTIIAVATGAMEPTMLYADTINKPFEAIRYSKYRTFGGDKTVKLPAHSKKTLKEKIRDKNVLVEEDVIASGESLVKVIKFVEKHNPKNLTAAGLSGRIVESLLKKIGNPKETTTNGITFYNW